MAIDMLEHFERALRPLGADARFPFRDHSGCESARGPISISQAIGFIWAIGPSCISFAKASARTAAWFNTARTDRKRPALSIHRLPQPGFGRHALLRL